MNGRLSAHIPWIELRAADHCNNVCRHCNQRSPYAQPRNYSPGDYLPWLEKLRESGIGFDQINVTGGEPFLHPGLDAFVAAFRAALPRTTLVVISNGFWLGEESFAAHAGMFEDVNALVVSLYPNLVHAMGGREAVMLRLNRLKILHPGLEIVTVGRALFYPVHFSGPENAPGVTCRWADCTGLLPDGRLTRCSVASSAHLDPAVPGPAKSADLHFDLARTKRLSPAALAAWRAKWPLDVCKRCTAPTARPQPWKALAARRRLDYELAYFERLPRVPLAS